MGGRFDCGLTTRSQTVYMCMYVCVGNGVGGGILVRGWENVGSVKLEQTEQYAAVEAATLAAAVICTPLTSATNNNNNKYKFLSLTSTVLESNARNL